MSCIPMAPIHSWHSMSHGHYKLQTFFQLSGQSMAVVKGTLMECEFLPLPKDGHALLHCRVVSQEMFEILYSMRGNPLHDNFLVWDLLIVQLSSLLHASYMCVSSPCLNCSFFQLLMHPFVGLSHHWASALPVVSMVTFPGWISQLLHSALI